MSYLFPDDAIVKLKALRKDYETLTGINLQNRPGFFGMPTALGGTDVITRAKQITFLEKILCVLSPLFTEDYKQASLHDREVHYSACKCVLAACLYIRSQISPNYKVRSAQNSDLYHLIDQAADLRGIHKLSVKDKVICYTTGARLLSTADAFERANIQLKKSFIEPFSEKEWKEFNDFVEKKSKQKRSGLDSSKWPVSNKTKNLFGYLSSTAGAASGLLAADLVAPSAIKTNTYMAKSIGKGIILFGIGSSLSAPYIASIAAGQLLSTFLQIFLAKSFHYTMQATGEKVGTAVGIPFDLVYQLFCLACGKLYVYGQKPIDLTGLRIEDGKYFEHGLLTEASNLLTEHVDLTDPNTTFIKPDGSFTVRGKELHIKDFTQDVIDEFNLTLNHHEEAEEKDDMPNSSETLTIETGTSHGTSML